MNSPQANARLWASQLLQMTDVAFSEEGDRVIRILISEDDTWRLQRATQNLAKRSEATYLSTNSELGAVDSDTSLVGDPMVVVQRFSDRAIAATASAFASQRGRRIGKYRSLARCR